MRGEVNSSYFGVKREHAQGLSVLTFSLPPDSAWCCQPSVKLEVGDPGIFLVDKGEHGKQVCELSSARSLNPIMSMEMTESQGE